MDLTPKCETSLSSEAAKIDILQMSFEQCCVASSYLLAFMAGLEVAT